MYVIGLQMFYHLRQLHAIGAFDEDVVSVDFFLFDSLDDLADVGKSGQSLSSGSKLVPHEPHLVKL